jgi:hypothetical protein
MINRFRDKLSRRSLPRLAGIILHFVALALLCSAQSGLSPRFGSLPKDEPQAIYHPDPGDSRYFTMPRGPDGHLVEFTNGQPIEGLY